MDIFSKLAPAAGRVALAAGLATLLHGCVEYLAVDPAPCSPHKSDAGTRLDAAYWPDAWAPDALLANATGATVNAGPLFPDANLPPCQDARPKPVPDAHAPWPDAACECDAPFYPDANPR
jgi:hypothetical protein